MLAGVELEYGGASRTASGHRVCAYQNRKLIQARSLNSRTTKLPCEYISSLTLSFNFLVQLQQKGVAGKPTSWTRISRDRDSQVASTLTNSTSPELFRQLLHLEVHNTSLTSSGSFLYFRFDSFLPQTPYSFQLRASFSQAAKDNIPNLGNSHRALVADRTFTQRSNAYHAVPGTSL